MLFMIMSSTPKSAQVPAVSLHVGTYCKHVKALSMLTHHVQPLDYADSGPGYGAQAEFQLESSGTRIDSPAKKALACQLMSGLWCRFLHGELGSLPLYFHDT